MKGAPRVLWTAPDGRLHLVAVPDTYFVDIARYRLERLLADGRRRSRGYLPPTVAEALQRDQERRDREDAACKRGVYQVMAP